MYVGRWVGWLVRRRRWSRKVEPPSGRQPVPQSPNAARPEHSAHNSNARKALLKNFPHTIIQAQMGCSMFVLSQIFVREGASALLPSKAISFSTTRTNQQVSLHFWIKSNYDSR